jgi:hypothetical protein
MKNLIKTMLGLFALFLISCQEVINVDLEQGEKRLVVEGRVALYKESANSVQEIRLTTTGDYFSNAPAAHVSEAEVIISDDQGQSVVLTEAEPGLYRTDKLKVITGNQYKLTIKYDGNIYQALETLVSVPHIDSVYQIFIEENLFDEAGIRLKIDYQDPANERNYYYWEQYLDGVSLIQPNPGTKWTLVSSDEFYNGQYVRGRMINDKLIYTAGQKGLVKQIALSEYAYRYYFALFDQEGSRGNLSSPPAPIRGNIENLTNPDKYALGYFYAAEISEKEIIIK